MVSTESNKKYQLLSALQDQEFNIAALSQYHLSLYVGTAYVKICCVNPIKKQCLLLSEYRLAHEDTHERIQAIKQLHQDHPVLSSKDWSAVTLCISNQQYTLIPYQLFQEKKLTDYLSFACSNNSDTAGYFTHYALNTTVVFAMDSWLSNWFQETYDHTQAHVIHQASSLIQGSWTYLNEKKLSALPKVLVFVELYKLHIIVIQKGKLIYYNRFSYANCDELLYYILVVMHTLRLDANSHEVILGGHINKQSPTYKKVSHYIRKLAFISKLPYLRTGRILSKKKGHAHLDVLSTHLCHR